MTPVLLNKFQSELEVEVDQRSQWSLTENCATYVARLLYDGGVSVIKPDMMMTPRKVFYMMDEVEQKAHIENLKQPSSKP